MADAGLAVDRVKLFGVVGIHTPVLSRMKHCVVITVYVVTGEQVIENGPPVCSAISRQSQASRRARA